MKPPRELAYPIGRRRRSPRRRRPSVVIVVIASAIGLALIVAFIWTIETLAKWRPSASGGIEFIAENVDVRLC
jgi:hypothetical protein